MPWVMQSLICLLDSANLTGHMLSITTLVPLVMTLKEELILTRPGVLGTAVHLKSQKKRLCVDDTLFM